MDEGRAILWVPGHTTEAHKVRQDRQRLFLREVAAQVEIISKARKRPALRLISVSASSAETGYGRPWDQLAPPYGEHSVSHKHHHKVDQLRIIDRGTRR